MNANFILKCCRLLGTLLIVSLFVCACGEQNQYEWQADRGADGEFVFSSQSENEDARYVLNVSSCRIHRVGCRHIEKIKEENRLYVTDIQRALEEEYRYCSDCMS